MYTEETDLNFEKKHRMRRELGMVGGWSNLVFVPIIGHWTK